MYDFYYHVMKPKYGANIKLLFTDTDSLCYEVKTNDIYEDMKSNADLYDFSEYPKSNELYDPVNKKIIGKFKDETSSVPIREFVGLRSKMYAFQFFDSKKGKVVDSKKLKGVKKTVVKNEVTFDHYKASLMGEKKLDIQQRSQFNCIRSFNHDVYSVKVNKIGICAFDDKRYLLDHVNTLSHGYYKIQKIKLIIIWIKLLKLLRKKYIMHAERILNVERS